MMHMSLGKKQPSASSSSTFMNMSMDESPSQYVDSSSVSSRERGQQQSIVSHDRNPLSLSESEIDELLQCPVCNDAMFPPIQQLKISILRNIYSLDLICCFFLQRRRTSSA